MQAHHEQDLEPQPKPSRRRREPTRAAPEARSRRAGRIHPRSHPRVATDPASTARGSEAPVNRGTAVLAEEIERTLLHRIAEGDEGALEDLYHRYQPRILAFAHQRLNDPHAASDTLNEVMLEVWKSAARFEGRSTVASWILSIARHRIIDRHRARGNRSFDPLENESLIDSRPSPEDALVMASDASVVRSCVERLPDLQREAIHLAFFEGLSYAEIARVMSCPEGTVKTRVYHAKQNLKTDLSYEVIAHAAYA